MVESLQPYGQALYDVAKETNKEAEYLHILEELCRIWKREKDFVLVLSHPKISKTKKKTLLMNLFSSPLDPTLMQTLLVFTEHGVVFALPKIFEAYQKCYQEDHNIELVLVKSASALSAEQVDSLTKMLEKKLQKKVSLTVKIEPELIAGLRVQAGNLVLDNTLLSSLETIKEKITS